MQVIEIFEMAGVRKRVIRLLRHRLGQLPQELKNWFDQFRQLKLGELSDVLLHFQAVAEPDAWVTAHK